MSIEEEYQLARAYGRTFFRGPKDAYGTRNSLSKIGSGCQYGRGQSSGTVVTSLDADEDVISTSDDARNFADVCESCSNCTSTGSFIAESAWTDRVRLAGRL